MSPTGARLRRLRRSWPVTVGVVALLAAAVLVAGSSGRPGPPLSPSSTGPLGTRGLVDVLRELGTSVEVARLPDGGTGAALLADDDLDPDQRAMLRGWVRDGGRLVVADPLSPLTPDRAAGSLAESLGPVGLRPGCDNAATAGVRQIRVSDPVRYDVPADALACFTSPQGAWLVARRLGDGTVVSLGGADLLTNQRLDEGDNAVLAATLLAGGQRPVTVVRPARPGEGSTTLVALVPDRVWGALGLLAAAGLLYGLGRGRRHGAVVSERLPVAVPASALVEARGRLMARAGDHADAAHRLRRALREDLTGRLGLPADAPTETVRDRAEAAGAPRRALDLALDDTPPRDGDGLAAAARAAAEVRAAVGIAATDE